MTGPQPTVTTVWAVRLAGPDGHQYQGMHDQEFAEFIADAVATHLAEVAAGRDQLRGPALTGVAVVSRERRVWPDGSEDRTAWQHVRDGIPVEG